MIRILLKSPILFVFIIMLFTQSCEKKLENTCGVDDPVKDLVWLKNQIGNIEQMSPDTYRYYYFSMASYNGQTVFMPGNCDPAANTIIIILDCSGELIGNVGNGDDMIPWDDIVERQVIWKPENSACMF